MEEEKVMKHKRKEKRDMMNGGPKFDPHIKKQLSCLVNPAQ